MTKSNVYFSKIISPEKVVEMFKILNKNLMGRIAIKVHSGEKGNQNFLKPEFFIPIVNYLNGTVVECNTAYEGARNHTEKHKELLNKHNWTKYFNVEILDEEKPDLILDIKNGQVIKKNFIGKKIQNYDSLVVLSHFKGHPMGGYGGALKQLSIGCASSEGKCYIHSAGVTTDQNIVWNHLASQNKFLEAMAESASSVINYFKGNIVYINIMCNMSVDCDCCAVAEDPCLKDIGILSSLDPVALDKACLDLIYNSNDEGKHHFIKRVESKNGIHTIQRAQELMCGTTNYKLICID